jgi:amino acid transporter
MHPRFQVPWFAISIVLAFAAVVDTILAVYLGVGFDITLWLANVGVFFALVTYLVINVCNPVLFGRRLRGEFHWFANGVVPLVGFGVVSYFMYKGFFQVLWNAGFKMGRSVVLTSVVLLLATAVVAWAVTRRPAAREAARFMPAEEIAVGPHREIVP